MPTIQWPQMPSDLLDLFFPTEVNGVVKYITDSRGIVQIFTTHRKPSDKIGVDPTEPIILFEATEEISHQRFQFTYRRNGQVKTIKVETEYVDKIKGPEAQSIQQARDVHGNTILPQRRMITVITNWSGEYRGFNLRRI